MDEYLSKSIEKIREDAAQRYTQLEENLNILAKVKPRDLLFIDNTARVNHFGTFLYESLGCVGYVTKPFLNDVKDLKGMHEKGIIVEFKKCERLFQDNIFHRFDNKTVKCPVYDDSKLHTEETAEDALKKYDFSLDDILKDLE